MIVNRLLIATFIGCVVHSANADEVVIIDLLLQYGGTQQAAPSTSSTALNYQLCTSTSSEKQSLLVMDVIGNRADQVPEGSTITSATLRLRSEVTGDGLLYRCAEPWDSTPTWNEVGNAMTIGSSIGIGNTTGPGFDVTTHVQAWADGVSNQGWVIKGAVNDCTQARIYNGAASDSLRPRLTVVFAPPDTTPPQIVDIDVGSTTSTHADYDVPVGSGQQITRIPVAKINQIIVTFSEHVTNVNAGAFQLQSANTATTYPLASGGVSYNSGTFTATFLLANEIVSPDQLVLTIADSVEDLAGNDLDGEWTPAPTSVSSSGTKSFPSGNSSAGGAFSFYLAVLPGDYHGNNVTDAADYTVWRNNLGMPSGAGVASGDGDGDGDVDNDDYNVWRSQFGFDYTAW